MINGVISSSSVIPTRRFPGVGLHDHLARFRIMRHALFALLAGMLLLVQTEGLWHHLDHDTHTGGHICEFCVGLATLDHSMPGAPQTFLPLAGIDVHPSIHHAVPFLPVSLTAYSTRAPPYCLIL